MTHHLRRRLVATTILAALSAPVAAFAQSAATPAPTGGENQLAEIVVTAQHVTENLQKAAISVTAATGDTLIRRGIEDTASLSKLVPGLNITPNVGYTNFNIRGITSGGSTALSDPSIAVNYNQVFLAFPSSASGLYYDLERVELVNGPQGILYGRNSTAGAINVVAKRPTFGGLDGNIGVDYGNYNQINARGAVNIPINDKMAFRIAAQTVNHDGYYSDGTSDQHDNAGRISFLAKPTETLSIYVSGDYAISDDHSQGATFQKACGTSFCYVASPTTGVEDLGSFLAPYPAKSHNSYDHDKYWGISSVIDWRTSVGTLTVIPAYRAVNTRSFSTSTSFGEYREWDHPDQASLEARFASLQDRALKYQVGIYGLSTDVAGLGGSETAVAKTFSDNFYTERTYSYAPFAQLTYSFTDTFRIVGGARYTVDHKSTDSLKYVLTNTVGPDPSLPDVPPTGLNPTYHTVDTKTWTATTWKGGFEWDVAPSSFAYANVSTGFKSGGFYMGPPGYDSYNPETVTAYMGGIKNRFFDNRLQVNFEGFYYDYSNQQIAVTVAAPVPLPGGGFTTSNVATTQNIGHSEIRGAELDVDWLALKNTRLGMNLQWTDGSYSKLAYIQSSPAQVGAQCSSTPVGTATGPQYLVDCSGHSIIGVAKWAVNASAQQTFPLFNGAALVAEGDLRYQGPRATTTLYTPGSTADAATIVDATLSYRPTSAKWDATAFVNDIAGGNVVTGRAQDLGFAKNGIYYTTLRAPRTFGVRLNRYF
jgi:iron complex outermembrane receptor protein